MCTLSLLTLPACLAADELHQYLPVCSEMVYIMIFIILGTSKKNSEKNELHKKKECWYDHFVGKKKKISQVYSGRSGLLLQCSKTP